MISLKATLKAITKALSVDYIVEQGTSGIWTYRKWNSGIAECWGTKTVAPSISDDWGNWKEGKISDKLSYPSGLFVENPAFFVGTNTTSNAFVFEHWEAGSATQTPLIYGSRPYAATFTATICLRAVGRWK